MTLGRARKRSPIRRHHKSWNRRGTLCGRIRNISYSSYSYAYSKQPIFGLTQEWLRELSFSRLECGVHDRLHIYPLA